MPTSPGKWETALLRFYDEPQPCRKCGEPCLTVKLGGRTPLHLGCDTRRASNVLSKQDFADLIYDLAEVLGPLTFNPPLPPALPRDYGPCRACGRWHRLYGAWGHPLCEACRIEREELPE